MEPKKTKALFTILYPFMSSVLELAGLAKECFAVIFGFWIAQGERPVSASITIMQAITGGSRPAIVKAIRHLNELGLIQSVKIPGKRTLYTVVIAPSVLEEFMASYPNALVKRVNHNELTPNNSAGQGTKPQKKSNPKREPYNTPLKVRTTDGINTGGLKEA